MGPLEKVINEVLWERAVLRAGTIEHIYYGGTSMYHGEVVREIVESALHEANLR